MNKKEIISLWNQTHTDKLKNIDTACAFYMSFEFKAFKSNNIKKRYQVYINRETGVWNNLVEGEEGVLFIGESVPDNIINDVMFFTEKYIIPYYKKREKELVYGNQTDKR